MKSKSILILTLVLIYSVLIFAQEVHDKGVFVKRQPGFYDEILKALGDTTETKNIDKFLYKVDVTGKNFPKSIDEFTQYWYNEPISQGRTGTCWSFSTTSFFESEVYRTHKKKVKLSEMYTVYWEYLEKAARFIEEKGNSEFGEGSEANALKRIWKKYGIVPEEVYTGTFSGQKFHDHKVMFEEMNSYLKSLKESGNWNKDEALGEIKKLLNNYMGEPPAEFVSQEIRFTPKEYLEKYLQINPDDYVDILSYMQQPYYQQVEYEVPDNWWHNKDYYNVPLDEYMSALKNTIKNGYTVSIGGDVSEAGYLSRNDVAIVPTFDIPSEYIDENARQFRFSNKTTTDDHGIHLVGYLNKDGKDWFLIKDSASGSRDGNNKGYYFYNEDYVKLKMLDFMVHKDAVKDLLGKFSN
ncbi:MAG: peptidase C1 [Ignavibacteria bacterium RBG_16_34_14]|nr:MAG: peptidase C1 [Ignavibacteria bacterium RBG_16_34_14]